MMILELFPGRFFSQNLFIATAIGKEREEIEFYCIKLKEFHLEVRKIFIFNS